MTYKVRLTSVKPEGTSWFSQSNAANKTVLGRFREWLKTQATGQISFSKTFPNPNTVVKTYEFDTKENFDAFLAAAQSHPDDLVIKAYNEANNIVTTRTEL